MDVYVSIRIPYRIIHIIATEIIRTMQIQYLLNIYEAEIYKYVQISLARVSVISRKHESDSTRTNLFIIIC